MRESMGRKKSRYLNHEARERLQIQISNKMDEINRICREEIKPALDYLEEARSSVYTEPMDDVQAQLKLAFKRLQPIFIGDAESINNMADVARQIHDGERQVNGSGSGQGNSNPDKS